MPKMLKGNIEVLRKLDRLSKLYKKFPQLAAVTAVNFSKERFVRKNWVDRSPVAWKANVKPPKWLPKQWKKKKGSILVQSARLKRSIRKISVTLNSVTIGTDVVYAQIHNEGGVITQKRGVKAHVRKRKGRDENVRKHNRTKTIKIPQRQFIGESAILLRRIERLLQKEMNTILNQ
jgi:phage gpG-like protein